MHVYIGFLYRACIHVGSSNRYVLATVLYRIYTGTYWYIGTYSTVLSILNRTLAIDETTRRRRHRASVRVRFSALRRATASYFEHCHNLLTMSLAKLLDPFVKPAARFYQARLTKELNKMGM